MTNVIIVHGFNDPRSGADNVDRLIPYIKRKGYNTVEVDYGWRGLIGVRICNDSTARNLLKLYKRGDIVIGYSNGCSIVARAIEMGLPVDHVIFIHPALHADWEPPTDRLNRKIYVYHSREDWTTKMAGWIRKYSPLNFIFGKTKWGQMGTIGSTSTHPSLINIKDGYDHFDGFKESPEGYIETIPNTG